MLLVPEADPLGPTNAVVERIEPYGLYLLEDKRSILVLIPDISMEPIRDLRENFRVGQVVEVSVLKYVPERGLFKGTML